MPDSIPVNPHDFDDWVALAISDPQAFETQRRQVIDRAISAAPADRQQQLRRIQWKLDQIRSTSRTPMVACLRLNRLLWESVTGENGLLACLQRPAAVRQRPAGAAARVIPLDPRR
ncbi:MAG: DUF3135 domain-containing protein [Gammaproteobacteria bacterium]|nr:DUF3135 domain-containing protein [Gammaproteobacteria bacterium]MDH3560344.1 DUF3135 domain-containing protein [Gammaproteobacteria bacterium]